MRALTTAVATIFMQLAAPLPSVPVESDACAALIPPDLRSAIVRRYSGYEFPRQSDNLAEDIAHNQSRGGTGCLGVAVGDFDGDNSDDLALIVTRGRSTVVVVGLRRQNGWILEELVRGLTGRNRQYVGVAPPGTYVQTPAADHPPQQGEVAKFSANIAGVVTGATESTAIAYFRTARGWVHVWVSD